MFLSLRPGQVPYSLRDTPDYSYRLHVPQKYGKLGGTRTVWDEVGCPELF